MSTAPQHSWRTGCASSVATRSSRGLDAPAWSASSGGGKPAAKGDIKVIGLRADMDALPIEEETARVTLPRPRQDARLRP